MVFKLLIHALIHLLVGQLGRTLSQINHSRLFDSGSGQLSTNYSYFCSYGKSFFNDLVFLKRWVADDDQVCRENLPKKK